MLSCIVLFELGAALCAGLNYCKGGDIETGRAPVVNKAVWLLSLVFILLGVMTVEAENRGVALTSAGERVDFGQRVALVIGNAAYPGAPLRNPVNDARDISAALEKCGFDVVCKMDSSLEEMLREIARLGSRARDVEAALFYYAGHGVQFDGFNYLVPVDGIVESQIMRTRCVNAEEALAQMEAAGSRVNLMILDACRNTPFSMGGRAVGGGLAVMHAGKGALIAYATAPGKIAADGTGHNGVFTGCLLKHLLEPGLHVRDMLEQVRVEVATTTGDAQIPWENSSLMGAFYFMPKSNEKKPQVAGKWIGTWQKTNGSLGECVLYISTKDHFLKGTGQVKGWTCWEVFEGKQHEGRLALKGTKVIRNSRPETQYELDTLDLLVTNSGSKLEGKWSDDSGSSGLIELNFTTSEIVNDNDIQQILAF